MNQIQHTINFCRAKGFSFFPVKHGSKTPCIKKWSPYQSRHPSDDEVDQWIRDYPDMNIGIVTGKISNLIVVDLDTQKGGGVDKTQFELPRTFSVRTGGGGEHHYYSYPNGEVIKNSASSLFSHVDIRGDGGYIVGFGSMHESGNIYEVMDGNSDIIADCPEWVYQKQYNKQPIQSPQKDLPYEEGGRNNALTQWLGKQLHGCSEKDLPDKWEGFKLWNSIKCIPPLGEDELKRIFDSIATREFPSEDKETTSQKCISLLEREGRFILDQIGDPCYIQKYGNSQKVILVESPSFKVWIGGYMYHMHGISVNPNVLSSVINIARYKAEEANEKQRVDIRIAKGDGYILYDIKDVELRCIRIDENGWIITNNNLGYFQRTKNTLEQVLPDPRGDVNLLKKYINISDEKALILIMSAIITMFIPDIQHPLLMIHGQKGSAKSTFLAVLKRLIDPSAKDLISRLPGDSNGLIHTLLSDYLLCYDNVSKISHDTSDDLCTAVTGGVLSKRKLYTDSDDVIYRFQKCICINGVNLEANQPDLLQRSIVIELEPIKNPIEGEFWINFGKDLPRILGGIFDTLSMAMSMEKDIEKGDIIQFRLADFSKWGEIISRVLGNRPGIFSEIYEDNLNSHDEIVLDSHIAISIFRDFMEGRPDWESTPTDLWDNLNTIALSRGKARYFPTSPQSFMKQLNRFKDNLKNAGITYECQHSGNRIITVTNHNAPATPFR